MALLTIYNEKQVAFWIDGYFSVTPSDPARCTVEREFERAKQEAIAAMQRHIDELREMSIDQWKQLTECCAVIKA